jgi:tRNA (guanine37-N1)-methyltransferase
MQIGVVSLFPEFVSQVGAFGVVGRAVERQVLSLQCENPRDYAEDVHRTVDDRPYGGGPGMVLKYEPCAQAIRQSKDRLPRALSCSRVATKVSTNG